MRLSKKWGALALAAMTAAAAISGCTQLEERSDKETVAATFGDEKITLDYVMAQMRASQYSYEYMFGALYGTTDFWHEDLGTGSTMENYVISNVLASIRQTKVLCDYAEKNGIALSDDQKQLVADAVAEALENEAEYYELIGMDEDMILEAFTENALANVVYMELVADVDTAVGDDEFIRKDFAYVRLGATDLEENSTEETTPAAETSAPEEASDEEENGTAAEDADEETTSDEEAGTDAEPAGEEEETSTQAAGLEELQALQAELMNEAAKEIEARLADGEAAADFISDYNEDATYFTATQSTVTIGETSSYIYTATAFALSEGETAIYTDESTGAIYILYCTNDNNEEARQEAIDSEIESRKAALFAEKYAPIQEESPKFKVDEEVLSAALDFHTPIYVADDEEEYDDDHFADGHTHALEDADETEEETQAEDDSIAETTQEESADVETSEAETAEE